MSSWLATSLHLVDLTLNSTWAVGAIIAPRPILASGWHVYVQDRLQSPDQERWAERQGDVHCRVGVGIPVLPQPVCRRLSTSQRPWVCELRSVGETGLWVPVSPLPGPRLL